MFQSKGPYYYILKADFAKTMIVSFVSHSGVTSCGKLSTFSFERADIGPRRARRHCRSVLPRFCILRFVALGGSLMNLFGDALCYMLLSCVVRR